MNFQFLPWIPVSASVVPLAFTAGSHGHAAARRLPEMLQLPVGLAGGPVFGTW